MDKSLHGQRLSEKTKDEKTGNILLDGRPPFMNRVRCIAPFKRHSLTGSHPSVRCIAPYRFCHPEPVEGSIRITSAAADSFDPYLLHRRARSAPL